MAGETILVTEKKETTILTQEGKPKTVVTQPAKSVTVLETLRGKQGSQGEPGVNWLAGQTWNQPVHYYPSDALYYNGSSYICIADHVSSGTDEPGVGANWESNWDYLAKGA